MIVPIFDLISLRIVHPLNRTAIFKTYRGFVAHNLAKSPSLIPWFSYYTWLAPFEWSRVNVSA